MSQPGYGDAVRSGAVPGQHRTGPAKASRNRRVASRLIVLVAIPAILSLTLAGLRLADTMRSEVAYGRIGRVAALGQQVTGLAQAMEDERTATAVFVASGRPAASVAALRRQYVITDRRAAAARRLALGLGSTARTQPGVARIVGGIARLPGLRRTAMLGQAPAMTVINEYSAAIAGLFGVNGGIASMSGSFALIASARTVDSLSRLEDNASLQRAILGAAFAAGHFGPGELAALTNAVARQSGDLAAFRSSASPEQNRALSSTLAQPLAGQARAAERRAMAAGNGTLALAGSARQQWTAGMSFTTGWMRQAGRQLAAWMVADAQHMRRNAMRSAIVTAGLVLAAMLLIVVASVVISRSVLRPIRRLEEAALAVAGENLPARVRELASLNALFVAFLRRSSSLGEPLLGLIDRFELGEADPERLDALFQMDHLATRMRRISDSALALAGDQAPRHWTEPVTLVDLLRAAVSETEQYGRIDLDVEPVVSPEASAVVTATAAADIVHLLAELLENATAFSSAMSQVIMSGRTARDGGWLVSIADRGIGMPEEQVRQLNEQLAHPPLVDAAADGQLGLFAVAHLAARHGIRVAIAQPPSGGTTVQVHIPAALISCPARPVTRQNVELLAAPLAPLPSPARPDYLAEVRATAAVSAQIARTRLTSFQQGSRRARAETRVTRDPKRTRDD